MSSTKKRNGLRVLRRDERGAALILTVVIIMVLTTLGLAMVSFTTTEEKTATSYRDSLQARAVAYAGVRVVEEMFRDPTNRSLVPVWSAVSGNCSAGGSADYCGTTEATTETSLNAKGIWRKSRQPVSPLAVERYTGAANKFFNPPFRDVWTQSFAGQYNSTPSNDIYDLKFDCTNPSNSASVVASANCWLDSNINALLQTSTDWNQSTGTITDISFYAPPTEKEITYGITTIRVTAVKTDSNGAVLARETIEAVIGDATPKPAVLGNGDISFKTTAGVMCGDGCEQIHANGNATVGAITGGTDPMVTATGTVTGGSGSTKPNTTAIAAPEINPWDLNYKPSAAGELAKYYLAAARPLDVVWTNADPTDNPPTRICGTNGLSTCQDYNLEYDTAGTVKAARSTTDIPYLYKWDGTKQGWTECSHGTTLNGGTQCPGAPQFTVTPANDVPVAGTGDTSHVPFNILRVPKTLFTIQSDESGATVLVDGSFYKSGALTTTMTIVAAGSFTFWSSSTWSPAMSNRVMWIAGRDIYTHSNCCAPSNTCSTNLTQPSYAGIIASHEQILTDSQNALLGVIVAENRVDFDDTVHSTLAIDSDKGDHASLCGLPDWPWSLPTTPTILSMKSVAE